MLPNRRRNSIESAVVLKSARMGEIHRSVTLFTPDRGVVYAIAHGAGKAVSKLKAAAIPFAHVSAYLYHDPVRGSFKVTDVEPRNLHAAIRTDLTKFFTASLWVEIVLRSHGGGSQPDTLHDLLVTGLDALDGAGATQVNGVSIQILWRCLQHLGIGPDLEYCDGCGRGVAPHEELRLALDGGSWCRHCAAGWAAPPATLRLAADGRQFLLATGSLELRHALGQSFDGSEGLRRSLQQLIQHGLEAPLNSLRCAAGIL